MCPVRRRLSLVPPAATNAPRAKPVPKPKARAPAQLAATTPATPAAPPAAASSAPKAKAKPQAKAKAVSAPAIAVLAPDMPAFVPEPAPAFVMPAPAPADQQADWECDLCIRTFVAAEPCINISAHKNRCPPCNSLKSRAFRQGCWDNVLALSAADAGDFFASAGSLYKDDITKKLTNYKVTNTESSRKDKLRNGEALPLSVWAQRGYDPDLIKKDCSEDEIEWKPKLGWCYYVVSESDLRVGSKGWTADENISSHRSSSSNGEEPLAKALCVETPAERSLRIKAEALEEKVKAKLELQIAKMKAKELKSLEEKFVQPLTALLTTIGSSLKPSVREFLSDLTNMQCALEKAESLQGVSDVVLVA